MHEWTLSEYWRIKTLLFPIAFAVILLWIYFGSPAIFVEHGGPLIIGAAFGILFFYGWEYCAV